MWDALYYLSSSGRQAADAKGVLTASGSSSPEGLREILRILATLSFVFDSFIQS